MANEPSTGADRFGFNPFPAPIYRIPGPDAFVGPLSAWRPTQTAADIACDYASQLTFSGDLGPIKALTHIGGVSG